MAKIYDVTDLMGSKKKFDNLKRKQKNAIGKTGKNSWTHQRELNVQNARIELEHEIEKAKLGC